MAAQHRLHPIWYSLFLSCLDGCKALHTLPRTFSLPPLPLYNAQCGDWKYLRMLRREQGFCVDSFANFITGDHRRIRGYMPAAHEKLYGRDPDIDDIAAFLTITPASQSKRTRFALLGPGGQGKTALALSVVAHPAVKSCYPGKNSVWVGCEEAKSAALLLDALHNSLDITRGTHNNIEDILDELQSSQEPILLLLDNFETPWNAPGARGAVGRILRDIAKFPHVALLLTMRAAASPCEEIRWVERRIQPLDPEAALQLYTSIHDGPLETARLPELFKELGHTPLAVKLMARHGKSTGSTVDQLISRYSLAMLGATSGADRENSVWTSISVSLDSPIITSEPEARALLVIIALLPSGTTIDMLQSWWASHLKRLHGALRAVREVSLLEIQDSDSICRVHPLVRSYLLDHSQLQQETSALMIKTACSFLTQYHCVEPGEPLYEDHATARAKEETNLHSILLDTQESHSSVIDAILVLAWHQYRIRPRTELIEHAVNLTKQSSAADFKSDRAIGSRSKHASHRQCVDHKMIGDIFDCYGTILFHLSRFSEAMEQFKHGRKAYLAASETSLAARMLLEIANASSIIDSTTNEIPQIEQAQHEMQSIDVSKRLRVTNIFSCLGGPFTKSFNPRHSLANTDMVICLHRLGRAHSRHYDYSQAIVYLLRARDLCADLPFEASQCAEDLAEAYYRLHQYDDAEAWGSRALEGWKMIGGRTIYSFWVLGMICIAKGKYAEAIGYLKEGLLTATQSENHGHIPYILLELGRAYMKQRKTDEARACFTESEPNSGVSSGDVGVYKLTTLARTFYLGKLDDPSRVPTFAEKDALLMIGHGDDIHP
ncbi:hypothetical protein C8J56DRAFT_1079105 [Mycena floridula]|nr:hypothetical protein C8J56DRAFT_1079105 [Mycena floridula]